jgi:GT2 family glycosyltransferase/tetratricopeptide (TPR) repeat protein
VIGHPKPAEFQALIGDADRLRDSRNYAAAAESYGAALALMPQRTDIRVQYANMLKDSGRFAEAEAAYRQAIAEMPDDADVHLQLGHALKLQGKRTEALASYRRSAALQPDNTDALKELFFAGAFDEQRQLFERRLAAGDIDAMLGLREEIARLQEMLQRLAEKLPDLQAQTAVPFAGYDRFRRLYDVPPAPAPLRARRFAVIMPTSDSALDILYAQLAALRAQTVTDWRLYVLGSDDAHRRIVERAAATDPRVAWVEATLDEDLADAERRIALSLEADWLLLLAEGALPHRRTLEWFAAVAARCSAPAYVTDEETVAFEGEVTRRSAPMLRQVVDFDTLLEANPFGDTIAVERTAYMQLADKLVTGTIASARASLLLHLADHNRVGHIPLPLLARDVTCPTEPPAAAHEAAVRAYLAAAAEQLPATVGAPDSPGKSLAIRWRPRNETDPLAVIVPTRDNGADLGNLIESLRDRAERRDALRVVIVDNGSRDPETLRILARLTAQSWARVMRIDEPFNWSRLNNRGVDTSDQPLVVFANDDMLMLSDGWDRQLRGLLSRPEIGAVGARLLYPDDTVQHGGILFDWQGSTIHDGLYEPKAHAGPCGRWHLSRAVSAVTGAFLAIRRDTFAAVGGFDEMGLPIAYSDFDLCLKLRARGLKILWTPQITLRHFESKSRGLDHLDPEKHARHRAERAQLRARWGAVLDMEPSVNPLWHQATLPFRLLAMPSEDRLWRHIRLCAASNPWLPDVRDEKTG